MTEGAQYKHFSEVLQCIKGKRLLRVHRAIRALAETLNPLLGRRVIRVLSVGKEIFFVFEQQKRPGEEDQALKIHFGDGPGYQYESAAGEVWGMVKRPSRRQPVAETELEFEGCRFRLWEDHNFYSHLYNVVDFGYVHTVEARRHRDIANDNFTKWTAEVVSLLRQRDGYIVDWIMDQTVMPGVGNIMKCEGLFGSGVHPLRSCKSLTNEELRRVVEELNRFALIWYHLCKRTGEGAPPAARDVVSDDSEQLLPKKCYGELDCTACGGDVLCIKLGARQRITYFCNQCQPPDAKHSLVRRMHKFETPLKVPLCKCSLPAQMRHVFHYGRDHGRVYFACRKSQQKGGRCRFRAHLEDLDAQDFTMPKCQCQPPAKMVLKRVMGLVDNGRYFAQCARKRCKYRVWIAKVEGSIKPVNAVMPQGELPQEEPEGKRWTRHKMVVPRGQQTHFCEPSDRLFVRRSVTGEFVHGREGVAQLGKHLLGAPDLKGVARGMIQKPSYNGHKEPCGSGTCTPVTSGAEDVLDDESDHHEATPDLKICFQKRWARQAFRENAPGNAACEGEEVTAAAVKLIVMDMFPLASPFLLNELLEEGMTLEQIVDCLSASELWTSTVDQAKNEMDQDMCSDSSSSKLPGTDVSTIISADSISLVSTSTNPDLAEARQSGEFEKSLSVGHDGALAGGKGADSGKSEHMDNAKTSYRKLKDPPQRRVWTGSAARRDHCSDSACFDPPPAPNGASGLFCEVGADDSQVNNLTVLIRGDPDPDP